MHPRFSELRRAARHREGLDAIKPDYYDIRTDKGTSGKLADLRAAHGRNASAVAEVRDELVHGESTLKAKVPTAKVEYNDGLKIPEIINAGPASGHASLTGQINSQRSESLRAFAKENKDLLGITDAQADDLRKTADYTNPNGELSYASLEQNINGVPVFQGEIKAGFNKRSEMFRVVNELAPGVDPATVSQDFGDPASAVRAAAANINVSDAKLDLAAKFNAFR